MHRAALALITGVILTASLGGQQVPGPQGATEAQVKSAQIEVPRLITMLELKPGMTVADVGAGFGAWTVALAKWIGPNGRVYSSDIGAQQLEILRQAVKREGLTNVTVLEAGERSTNLPPGCCDAILIRDAYHHLTQPMDVTRSFAASLKPGGRLAVIDFPTRPNTEVPAGVPANRGGHGVPPEIVVKEVTAAGFTHLRTETNWSPDSQPAMLFIALFRKSA
jgi:predicted methyltransferase